MTIESDEPGRPQPIKPLRLRASVDLRGDELRVEFRHRDWAGGGFMLLWLIGWTVGCVMLAGMVLTNPSFFTLLFAMPFFASWIFVFFALLNAFFQIEMLALDREGVKYERRVFVRLAARSAPLHEIKGVESFSKVVESESGRTELGIEFVTLGRSIRCLQGLSSDEIAWLQFTLEGRLGELASTAPVPRGAGGVEPAPSPAVVQPDRNTAETLVVQSTIAPPPSDCAWSRVDAFRDICFLKRGKLSWVDVPALIFVTLFWNGGVGVFVAVLCGIAPVDIPPEGAMWWGMFVFLIPFEVIGMIMIGGLIAAMLEPVHWVYLTFSDDQIELRHAWLGVGWRHRWPVAALGKIQLRRQMPSRFRGRWMVANDVAPGADFRLTFVDRDACELCTLDNLTEGEARWIGQIILRERTDWFPR